LTLASNLLPVARVADNSIRPGILKDLLKSQVRLAAFLVADNSIRPGILKVGFRNSVGAASRVADNSIRPGILKVRGELMAGDPGQWLQTTRSDRGY